MHTYRMFGVVLLTFGICSAACLAKYPGEPTTFPQQAKDRYEQGRALQKKGQLKEAIDAYDAAIDMGMQAFPRVHLYRANTNLELKAYDTAIAQFTKFIEEFGLEKSCRL
jgi:tetratricopeptide (TPR) repeat protein